MSSGPTETPRDARPDLERLKAVVAAFDKASELHPQHPDRTAATDEYEAAALDEFPGLLDALAAADTERDRLRLELDGSERSRALLLKGMESQAELMDGLKQRARQVDRYRAALSEMVKHCGNCDGKGKLPRVADYDYDGPVTHYEDCPVCAGARELLRAEEGGGR